MMTNQHLAIVFPGQGSQSVGMLSEIANTHPVVHDIFVKASQALDYDLWRLIQEGPVETLDQTVHTQPALLAASYALWQVLNERTGILPAFLAGHSLGEYTALVCAGALDFSDAIQLVAARGRFMQEAVVEGTGAMAAIIGLEDHEVTTICSDAIEQSEEVLSPANYNSVGQIVISGHREAVLRAITLAKERGAKMAVLIPVSVPSHCALMTSAADRLAEMLVSVKLSTPCIPVINNADVCIYHTSDAIRSGLVRQLCQPVRWVETIRFMQQEGVTRIIECGPGKVLSGLNKRIDKHLQSLTTLDLASLRIVHESF